MQQYKSGFSLIAEQMLVFLTRPNLVREVASAIARESAKFQANRMTVALVIKYFVNGLYGLLRLIISPCASYFS